MMKLITFKPITFLLKFSVSNHSSNKIEDISVVSTNKSLSLIEVIRVTLESQQKSIGFSILKNWGLQFKNKISKNILVGKDKSVVTICKMVAPTASILQL